MFRLTGWSRLIQAGLLVSRLTWGSRSAPRDFAYRAITFCGPFFQTARLSLRVLNAAPLPRRNSLRRFGLFRFRSPLLAESRLFSFPPGTEMFHFPGFAPLRLFIQRRVRRHYPPWVSPFGHRRIKAWLAAPRRFSQLPASFFASCRLGILRVPLVAWSSFSLSVPMTKVQPGRRFLP